MSTPNTEPHTPERAKQLAGLLRADLAAAGHAIPHALALELIAHQYGARDWNTYRAGLVRSPGRTVDTAPDDATTRSDDPLEWETVDQTTVAMTVGDLRDVIADLPATTPILLSHPVEAGPDATRHSIPATGADVRPSLGAPGDHLTLYGELGSGRHRRARRLTVTVSGLPRDDNAPATALVAAVRAAVAELGQRGVRIRNSPDEGSVRWTWTSTTVPLDRIAATARRAIADLDPGTWEVSDNSP